MFEQIRRSAQIFVAAIHVGKNGRFLLEPGELLALVESWGWTVKHYREGEYKNPIASWPTDVYNWPEDFNAGSKQNVGRYTIGSKGDILDKATGERPPFIMGFPFPKIARTGPMPSTSRRRSGSASMTSNTFSPKARRSFLA